MTGFSPFRRLTTLLLAGLLVAGIGQGVAQDPEVAQEEWRDAPAPDGLRPGGTIGQELPAPPLAGQPRHAGREVLNYPEQPPVIPHGIRDYQVDLRTNRCLECHSRSAAVQAGAPMVSISHFRDRHMQVLAAVSPDRYFCTQCHVPQTDATPIVGNTFLTVDEVLTEMLERERGAP